MNDDELLLFFQAYSQIWKGSHHKFPRNISRVPGKPRGLSKNIQLICSVDASLQAINRVIHAAYPIPEKPEEQLPFSEAELRLPAFEGKFDESATHHTRYVGAQPQVTPHGCKLNVCDLEFLGTCGGIDKLIETESYNPHVIARKALLIDSKIAICWLFLDRKKLLSILKIYVSIIIRL